MTQKTVTKGQCHGLMSKVKLVVYSSNFYVNFECESSEHLLFLLRNLPGGLHKLILYQSVSVAKAATNKINLQQVAEIKLEWRFIEKFLAYV